MSHRDTRVAQLLPAAFAAACGGITAEAAATMLLYDGPGFLSALTLVLTVEAGAFGFGATLRGGEPVDRYGLEFRLVERVRTRWVLTLVAFTAATVFAAFWSTRAGITRLEQGLGLALLAGLPCFALGSLLGEMARARVWRRTLPRHGSGRLGEVVPTDPAGLWGAAGLGAAVGFLAGGALLARLSPFSIFLGCVVVLSGMALLHGWALERVPVLRIRRRWSEEGMRWRSEEWVLGAPPMRAELLREEGRVHLIEEISASPEDQSETVGGELSDDPPEGGAGIP